VKFLLLDTNVVSILFKPEHSLHKKCFQITAGYQWFISFMTRSELLLWPIVNQWGFARREQLKKHIDLCTTLLPGERTCEFWADIMAESRAAGRPITTADAGSPPLPGSGASHLSLRIIGISNTLKGSHS
jgi:predicted nucleic acid-binding protein